MSSLLAELAVVIEGLGLPVVTGVHSENVKGGAGGTYVTMIPMNDILGNYSDNEPTSETQHVRLSLFWGQYEDGMSPKRRLTRAFLRAGFDITGRHYVGFDAGHHHYAIDVAKNYHFDLED